MREHDRIVRCKRLELVRRSDKGKLRQRRDAPGDARSELPLAVEPGTDRSAALGERVEVLEADTGADDSVSHLRGVAGELLSERKRRRVLGVSAPDLDRS